MFFLLLADAVVVLHLVFVLFVVFGGLLAFRWRKAAWAHVPAALWGAAVEVGGWICPLTPLEHWLRLRAGAEAYQSDFVARYVVPAVYPPGLTREAQVTLGLLVLAFNAAIYWRLLTSRDRSRGRSSP